MVSTQANGSQTNDNTNRQMNELCDMMQTLIGAMNAQQQLLQQHLQPLLPQQSHDQYFGGEDQQQGETSEYRRETEDQALLT